MIKTKGFMQYLAGGIFLCMAVYQATRNEPWELAMYASAGAAFITTGLLKDNKFESHKSLLNVLSWVLLIIAGVLFLFLLRTDE